MSGITYGVDAIEQFQVITSGAQAEFGRALGGYINVVTRSGNNTLRGTVYDFVRDDALNAANALSGTTLPMNQSQFGVSLGGPIVKNRTFYFGNVEKRALDQTGLTTISDTNAAVDQRAARGRRLRRARRRDRHLPQSGRHHQRPGQDRSPIRQRRISSACATAATTWPRPTRAAPAA